jgi:hypothetical protein
LTKTNKSKCWFVKKVNKIDAPGKTGKTGKRYKSLLLRIKCGRLGSVSIGKAPA